MSRLAEEDNWSNLPDIMNANKMLSNGDFCEVYCDKIFIFLTDKHLAEDYAEASNCKQAKLSWADHNHLGKTFINMQLP